MNAWFLSAPFTGLAGLAGRDRAARIYFDTSYSHAALGKERMRRLVLAHGADKILFGSDSPWVDQRQAVEEIHDLGLEAGAVEGILGGNARSLLEITK